MGTLAEKMDKQFQYQKTRYETSGDQADLFVSVGHLAAYLSAQTRQDLGRIQRQVKGELERRVTDGQLRRWSDVHGPSCRSRRADDYFLLPTQSDT